MEDKIITWVNSLRLHDPLSPVPPIAGIPPRDFDSALEFISTSPRLLAKWEAIPTLIKNRIIHAVAYYFHQQRKEERDYLAKP